MPVSRRTLLSVGGLVVAGGAVGIWRATGGSRVELPSAALPANAASPPLAGDDPRMAERSIGRADAPVTVTEWFSLTCPHCAAFHRESLPKIRTELVDTGKVRLVFRDFPLDQVALTAAMVAHSLPPERYEPFVAALLATQDRWAFARGVNSTEELAKMAALAGMSREAFNAAIADQGLRMAILMAQDEASKVYHVDSTPTFIFNGPKAKDRREAGARSFEDFAKLVADAAG
ncbi:DsbA family protein [Limobrevibacterium gyesilva]|uniref:DsbA family protein n=1 Tax=Limobrevibacterium gyesilva TaxID=2991712 RepID=A0AA41YRJ3_9PROT|nr:DsbA family protein [Limobrevibacterium gyesilva]MCW3476998.1 DsbA family protein [Limobrevibacterium gyesilva]